MSVALFLLLGAIAAVVIGYPLLPGQRAAQAAPAVSDREIEQAVQRLQRARSEGGLHCPNCGAVYQAGDRFCMRCGETLPQAGAQGPGEMGAQTASVAVVCPSCGAVLREGDQFCAKCGRPVGAGEVA
jgi:uncharacterized OB-fold protein